jgi:hypothetical protein
LFIPFLYCRTDYFCEIIETGEKENISSALMTKTICGDFNSSSDGISNVIERTEFGCYAEKWGDNTLDLIIKEQESYQL